MEPGPASDAAGRLDSKRNPVESFPASLGIAANALQEEEWLFHDGEGPVHAAKSRAEIAYLVVVGIAVMLIAVSVRNVAAVTSGERVSLWMLALGLIGPLLVVQHLSGRRSAPILLAQQVAGIRPLLRRHERAVAFQKEVAHALRDGHTEDVVQNIATVANGDVQRFREIAREMVDRTDGRPPVG